MAASISSLLVNISSRAVYVKAAMRSQNTMFSVLSVWRQHVFNLTEVISCFCGSLAFSCIYRRWVFFKHCSRNDESIWLNPSHLVEQPLNAYSQLDGIGKNSPGN